ncbi:hypothetical protein VB636_18010, partial [Paracoccus sp. APAP_BH8]
MGVDEASLRVVIGSVATLVLIGLFGMWDDTMKTISMVAVCTLIAVVLGIPIGIRRAAALHRAAIGQNLARWWRFFGAPRAAGRPGRGTARRCSCQPLAPAA